VPSVFSLSFFFLSFLANRLGTVRIGCEHETVFSSCQEEDLSGYIKLIWDPITRGFTGGLSLTHGWKIVLVASILHSLTQQARHLSREGFQEVRIAGGVGWVAVGLGAWGLDGFVSNKQTSNESTHARHFLVGLVVVVVEFLGLYTIIVSVRASRLRTWGWGFRLRTGGSLHYCCVFSLSLSFFVCLCLTLLLPCLSLSFCFLFCFVVYWLVHSTHTHGMHL